MPGKGGSASNTPRKGDKTNGNITNGTPRRIETKIQNGKSISMQGRKDTKPNMERESSNVQVSRENSTDSENNTKIKPRPLSSKSLGRATMTAKISNAEEKKLKRHMSKHRIGNKTPPVQNSIREKPSALKNTISKLKSSKVVDKEPSTLNIEVETPQGSTGDRKEGSVVAKDEKPKDSSDKPAMNGKTHWNKLSGVIQKEKSAIKSKSLKKEQDNDAKSLLRDGTKSSLGTLQVVGDSAPAVNAHRYLAAEEKGTNSVVTNNDSWIQSAIPYLPLGLSVVCLIMNIIIPWIG